ncbi:hypothetical protein ACFSQ7_08065 [Paenibacillus rhizoplanae]
MLTRPNLGQIANPTPLMEQLLDEAGWYQSAQPTADFSNMSDPTLFAFRTANGGSAKYVRDSYGEKLTAYDGNPSGGGAPTSCVICTGQRPIRCREAFRGGCSMTNRSCSGWTRTKRICI